MLITGDAGYIGTHLRKLFPDAEGCDLKRGEDYRSIHGRELGVVVHLAASVSVTGSMENPLRYFQNNAIGLSTFLTANKVGRLVFLSTCALYGNVHLAKESDARWENCLNPYAQSKLLGENVIGCHQESHVILRLGNVYGGDYSVRGEAAVHSNFEKDNPIVVYGGTQTRDFVHIDTVCHAIRAAVEGEMRGPYNIASGQETLISGLAESYGRKRGVPVEYLPARAGETEYISLDCGLALNDGLITSSALHSASNLVLV
jgi:nucleoside-diphosphate-sugar epimerase